MKKTAIAFIAFILCICICAYPALAAEYLVPVGEVVGLELRDGRVRIAEFDQQLGAAARAAGLRTGDIIQKIDKTPIRSVEDIRQALDLARGRVSITVLRQGKCHVVQMNPCITPEGPKLGLLLRQGVTGIGTVTFFDPETQRFGCLGHGVNGAEGLVDMISGSIYDASVASVRPGQAGKPGLLRGAVEGGPIGSLERNTVQGVFGKSGKVFQNSAIPVASSAEVREGAATIRSTVAGDVPQEYSVEILKIYPKDRDQGRNMLIRVTDQRLLEITGGIVQGMSGSPIIQNGKLIGAVTHVCVN